MHKTRIVLKGERAKSITESKNERKKKNIDD